MDLRRAHGKLVGKGTVRPLPVVDGDELEKDDDVFNEILKEAFEAIPKEGEYVFINPKTKTKYTCRDKFVGTLCRKAGVKRFTYHCLRHLGSSLLADGGEALTTIQNILGHERATTTDIYLRSINKSVVLATKKLEGIK